MPSTKDATGYLHDSGQIQLAVRMPRPLFNGLQKIAVEENTSMNRKMQELIAAAVKASREKK